MKYLKTEDGRLFNKSKIICHAFREEYISSNWNDDIEKYLQTKIVAEADTVEELCDFLIVKEKGWSHPFDPMGKSLGVLALNESWHKLIKEGRIEWVKAAIWTDKGLIYVAEMKGISPLGKIDWKLL